MPATTVAQYLAALPADRRAAISAVRKVINDNLPAGYEEGMQFGMIGWYVPLSLYPAGYGENPKVPLPLVALGSQKSGMGKGCGRFKKLDDLALDVVGRTVARVPVEEHTANYRAARGLLGKSKA